MLPSRMRVVGFVPSKLNSQRLPRKNVLPLAGRPLVNWVLGTLASTMVDETVVYACDDEIGRFIEPDIPYRFVARPPWLDGDDATVQDFVGSFLEQVECDVVVLLHITSPFLDTRTVDACIEAVVSGRYESSFAALEFHRFAWFGGVPINYSLNTDVPRTQDLEPVLVEQSGLYVFTRDLFERTGQRVAQEPYVHTVGLVEGHDIDTAEEYELAGLFAQMRSGWVGLGEGA